METAQWASGITAVTALLALVFAYFKPKPGEKEVTETTVAEAEINIAQGTLNIAQGSMTYLTTQWHTELARLAGQVDGLHDDLKEMRGQNETLRARVDELGREVRAERDEKERVKRENVELKRRVADLENEVRDLKGRP